jgi:hypothetical protein
VGSLIKKRGTCGLDTRGLEQLITIYNLYGAIAVARLQSDSLLHWRTLVCSRTCTGCSNEKGTNVTFCLGDCQALGIRSPLYQQLNDVRPSYSLRNRTGIFAFLRYDVREVYFSSTKTTIVSAPRRKASIKSYLISLRALQPCNGSWPHLKVSFQRLCFPSFVPNSLTSFSAISCHVRLDISALLVPSKPNSVAWVCLYLPSDS